MRPTVLSIAFAGLAAAHGGASAQKPIVDPNANWMTKHMAGTCRPQAMPLLLQVF
jgi:hypothetical protein